MWKGANHVGENTSSATNNGGKRRWDTLEHNDGGTEKKKRSNRLVRPLLDNGKGKTSLTQPQNLVLNCQTTGAVQKSDQIMATRTMEKIDRSNSHSTGCAGVRTNDQSCNDKSSSTGVEQVNENLSDHRVDEPVPRHQQSQTL